MKGGGGGGWGDGERPCKQVCLRRSLEFVVVASLEKSCDDSFIQFYSTLVFIQLCDRKNWVGWGECQEGEGN